MFSLLLLLVPLYLLYELSIILLVLLPSGRVAQGTLRIGPRGFEPLSHSVRTRGMVFRVPMVRMTLRDSGAPWEPAPSSPCVVLILIES